MRCFTEVCRKRGLKVNAGKRKVMVLGGEEGLKCEVCVDGICLEQVLYGEWSRIGVYGGALRENAWGVAQGMNP